MAKKTAKEAAETRERIINAAYTLCGDKGFSGTGTAEIAAAAGVTDGALFHHFKDKKVLFREVVDRAQREFNDGVMEAASSCSSARTAFLTGARMSLILSQRRGYQQIVLIDAPAVLGSADWHSFNSALAMKSITPTLLALAGKSDVPDTMLKPMGLLILGLLNETIFALNRQEPGVNIDSILVLLEQSLNSWLERVANSGAKDAPLP